MSVWPAELGAEHVNVALLQQLIRQLTRAFAANRPLQV